LSGSEASWQVWQNKDVARGFTETRRGGILGAEAQMATMLHLLQHVEASPLTVLDLGCGDGILLETISRAYPVERGVGLDGSPAMLEKAEVRFEGLGLFASLVEFVQADFNDPAWTERLPVREFDAIVSGFAIHHSEDPRKRKLYTEIFGLLKPGGLFVNIEHVASPTPLGEVLFERAYAETVASFRNSIGVEASPATVYEELKNREDKLANRLAPVETQLRWLREIGFRDVDCYWKHYELAVLAGYRPIVANGS
jgi:tRNA (cmo5U34)-methyltransferase